MTGSLALQRGSIHRIIRSKLTFSASGSVLAALTPVPLTVVLLNGRLHPQASDPPALDAFSASADTKLKVVFVTLGGKWLGL